MFTTAKSIILLLGILFTLGMPVHSYGLNKTEERELGIKAAFLLGFRDFVKWEDSELQPDETLKIGLIGSSDFPEVLKQALKSKHHKNRPTEIILIQSPNQIESVHFLYVMENTRENWDTIFSKCRNSGILTVSDQGSFADEGGMIQFIKVNNRFKFRINIKATREANLHLSSKLVRLSHGGNS